MSDKKPNKQQPSPPTQPSRERPGTGMDHKGNYQAPVDTAPSTPPPKKKG